MPYLIKKLTVSIILDIIRQIRYNKEKDTLRGNPYGTTKTHCTHHAGDH